MTDIQAGPDNNLRADTSAVALLQAVHGVFGPEGSLAHANPFYRVREGQLRMAEAVALAVAQRDAVVVEAGTGVGKTFAYLVPALLGGDRILVSTATKMLQDQLFSRDLPYLCQLLGLPVRLAMLKGRGSYVCLHRLRQSRQDVALADRAIHHALARIEQFVQHTHSGDLAELPGLDERSPVIPLATSTRENCLGSQCPDFKACYVNQARREALAADVVVINHHLFFADLAVRESGMAELLPTVQTVVFDEAHQLNEIGVQFLGMQIGTGHLLDLARDLLAAGLQQARGLADWTAAASAVERAARDLRLVAGKNAPQGKLGWSGAVPQGLDAQAWGAALGAIRDGLEQAAEAVDTVTELSPDFPRLLERIRLFQERLERFRQPQPADAVRWLELGSSMRLVQSPLDIAVTVKEKLLGGAKAGDGRPHAMAGEGQAEPSLRPGDSDSRQRSWIFTSATLGDEQGLQWFTVPCGLDEARCVRVESPFDYARHAALYIPESMSAPGQASHPVEVAELAAAGAAALGGRTLVLTTTLRSLRIIGDHLRQRFGASGQLEVLEQGTSTKRRLIERFRQGSHQGAPGCILVASASFWEGVDVPGDALELVVIDKLPFPPPHDPLVQARASRLEAEGRNAFSHYHLPEAAVMLKQGAGRLIRRESDQGILVVCDTRLRSMGYGRRLRQSLPPMAALNTHADFMGRLEGLAARHRQEAGQ